MTNIALLNPGLYGKGMGGIAEGNAIWGIEAGSSILGTSAGS
ncbi:hypothetical protein [Mycolicibacterium fortuitum]|nr:hypothetical protein [Mycolicibacterium fortuitum]